MTGTDGTVDVAPADLLAGHDPLDPGFRADPYALWQRLLDRGAVHRWDDADAWLVVGHEAARDVLRDTDHFSPSRRFWKQHDIATDSRRWPALNALEDHGLFHVGPADHVRLRRLVARAFTPSSISALEPRIAARVSGHLDRIAPKGACDLATELAAPLPIEVIADYLGLEESQAAWFRQRVGPLVALTDPFLDDHGKDLANSTVEELDLFLADEVERRTARPGTGLLDRLLERLPDGDAVSPAELTSLVVTLLLAGAETTMHLITLGALALVEHPDQLAILETDPQRWPQAIEELLRWSYIGTAISRFTISDVVVGGRTIERGELVVVAVGAAAHDPSVLDDPARLDVTRITTEPLTFGIGPHYCLGAALARAEGLAVLRGLFDRLRGLALDGEPRYNRHFALRGLEHLPVRWNP